MSQGQMFFLLPPVSSKFCSSITNDVRLKASSCFSPPFVPPSPTTKGMDFSQNTGHRTHELSEAKMGISLKKKKKKGIDVEHLDGSFTKYFSGYKNVLMTEGSLHLPRPATCSVLRSPLCQQVYCMNLPEIHPLKH